MIWNLLRSKYNWKANEFFLEFAMTKTDDKNMAWIRACPTSRTKHTVDEGGITIEEKPWNKQGESKTWGEADWSDKDWKPWSGSSTGKWNW